MLTGAGTAGGIALSDGCRVNLRWRGRQVARQPSHRFHHCRTRGLVPARGKTTQLVGIDGQGLGGRFMVRPAATTAHQPAKEPAVRRLALGSLVAVALCLVDDQADLLGDTIRGVELFAIGSDLAHAGDREALVL